MSSPKQRKPDRRHSQQVRSVRIAAPLLDGPRTLEEIVDRTWSYLRPLGLFKANEHRRQDEMKTVREQLETLIERGWISQEDDYYTLTPIGRDEVNERLAQLQKTGDALRKLTQPATVAKITTVAHWALAALKLPAGLISGSVGLINDATDTLLDGLSSLLVTLGIRFNKERAVNIVLVVLMLVTGGLTLVQAGRRFLTPTTPEIDWLTFVAAIVSGVICLGLWAYQRYVGLRSGTMALIIQSVDSKNHVIVATSVTAGLIAALLDFPLLDTLVGLAVALLILKSAIELAIETIRSLGEEEADLSHYQLSLDAPFHHHVQTQLRSWMLYLIEEQSVSSRAQLVDRAGQALDFNHVPAVRAMGFTPDQPHSPELVEQSLDHLFENGWITGEETLQLTDAGHQQLKRWL